MDLRRKARLDQLAYPGGSGKEGNAAHAVTKGIKYREESRSKTETRRQTTERILVIWRLTPLYPELLRTAYAPALTGKHAFCASPK